MANIPGKTIRPITRKTHGAQLFWEDGGKTYIHVDVIPTIENALLSSITEFPLEDGAPINEHIIHFPEMLQLEIAQTQTPFEDTDGGKLLEFKKAPVELKIPKTRFKPKGLLFLTLKGENALGAVTGAIGSLLGFEEPKGPSVEVFAPPYKNKDRINELYDKLADARNNGRQLHLWWLGRTWDGFAIEALIYSRKAGPERGNFGLVLKKIDTVSTKTTSLTSPAEARLAAGLAGGIKPPSQVPAAARPTADSTVESSFLYDRFN